MEKLVQISRELALQEIEQYGLPNILNFEISEKKGLELADILSANSDIVAIGVYLMDLKLGQASHENRLSEHVQMGIETARIFLEDHNVDKHESAQILNCIEAHHG
jgi:HD superfamily phosphodiesterase